MTKQKTKRKTTHKGGLTTLTCRDIEIALLGDYLNGNTNPSRRELDRALADAYENDPDIRWMFENAPEGNY